MEVDDGEGDEGEDGVCAVSVDMAARILATVPLIQTLEIEFLSLNNTYYISSLPTALADALASHTQIRHFRISCDGETNNIVFQLDEKLVANIVSGFPRLSSLILHRVNYDILLRSSPLLDAVAKMTHLRKLSVIDVQAVSELWAARRFSSALQELALVCCPRVSPASLDDMLEQHKATLSSLSLVDTPNKDQPLLLHSCCKAKYDLPALQSLSIQGSGNPHHNTIAFLERFSKTDMSLLSVGSAASVTLQNMEDFILSRQLKRLATVEVVGLFDGADVERAHMLALVAKAENIGIRVVSAGKRP